MLDIIFIVAILLTFFRGWQKGFLLSIIGPLALFVGSLAAYAYYKSTGDLLMSLVISVVVPIAIPIATACFVYALKLLEPASERSCSLISRLAGGIVQAAWCVAFILMTFLCIHFAPIQQPWFQKTRSFFEKSRSFTIFSRQMAKLLPEESYGFEGIIQKFANQDQLKNLDQTPEFNDLMQDPSFEGFIHDPEIQNLVENNAVFELIQHPKFKEMMKDPQVMDKLMAVYQNVFSNGDEPQMEMLNFKLPEISTP
ncbi:MAG: CvpA family protein [Candidatus Omnitrophica bacterium]|nr:CvpA family protein [Candidatus Omnitrophota bacterium]